ncbi:plasmid pRiA4b ORF-3 family protein [Streptomyces sp. H34-S4]|uniref:plasmid pRiA4b ORF-3 family protein n=1 Tax=Streptomyces sp. H34-S4 TaxID=2996463 RepID=UPI00226F84B0|nr:plasmid pRiA4b ORF-3 family protein [Streptomyces sp. H34-S4]MCY0933401.1 plasmid pRiA4b ORF-3 family protein [Streptomyces sp. H34-S4]
MPRRETTAATADLQLKVVLQGTKPPLWRRIVVPSDASLGTLHEAIQLAFGWSDAHLHLFADEFGRRYGDSGSDSVDEDTAALGGVFTEDGARLRYTYDFGDDWEHRITLERTLPRPAGAQRAVRCTGGRRADVPGEDLGGVWGLAEVLDLLGDADGADHELYGELIADLRAGGYDPAVFDQDEITRRLARLVPDTVSGAGKPSRGGPAGSTGGRRPAVQEAPGCVCGRCRTGDLIESDFEDLDEDVPPLRPVTLAPREELIEAALRVPLFDAARRLSSWCAEGRQITAGKVLRPAVARAATEELELWKLADSGSAWADETSRAAALKSLRSAADVPVLDEPWRLAVDGGLITLRGNRAWGGDADDFAGEDFLAFWTGTLGELLEEITETGVLDGLPGNLGAVIGENLGGGLDELTAEIADGMVGLMYDVPDGDWLDMDEVLGRAREEYEGGAEFALVEALFSVSFRKLGEVLTAWGAVEYEPGEREGATPVELLRAVMTVIGGREPKAPEELSGGPGGPGRDRGRADRMRLTPLGRYGVRAHLMDYGVPAPLLGEYAEADADTLLTGILSYPPDAMRQEVDGWLERRSAADAAVSLLDACVGEGPEAAAKRSIAQLVLADIDDPRALKVLHKAAAATIEGCRQVAAATVGMRPQADERTEPPVDRERTEASALWLLIDGLSVFAGVLDSEELAQGFRENRLMTTEALEQRVDDLWRVAHPDTTLVLAELGEGLRGVDKRLAKRMRVAANKARSRS